MFEFGEGEEGESEGRRGLVEDVRSVGVMFGELLKPLAVGSRCRVRRFRVGFV